MSCVCVWNPSSWEIVFSDQWKCGLYGFVLPPWHCTLPAGLTVSPDWASSLPGVPKVRLSRTWVSQLPAWKILSESELLQEIISVCMCVFLFLPLVLVTSLHLLSPLFPTSSSLPPSFPPISLFPSPSLPLFMPCYLLALSLSWFPFSDLLKLLPVFACMRGCNW